MLFACDSPHTTILASTVLYRRTSIVTVILKTNMVVAAEERSAVDSEDEQSPYAAESDSFRKLASSSLASFTSIDDVLSSPLAVRAHFWIVGALFLANACDAVEVLSIGYILNVYTDSTTGEHLSTVEEQYLTSAVFCGKHQRFPVHSCSFFLRVT